MKRPSVLGAIALILAGCSSTATPSVPAALATPSPAHVATPYPTFTPHATYTPYPTYTPAPTYTAPPVAVVTVTLIPTTTASAVTRTVAPGAGPVAVPISAAVASRTATASPSPTPQCIDWMQAAEHMGETLCVRGTVYATNLAGNTFFIDFDRFQDSFYAVSFRYAWQDLKGKCVQITGKVTPYRERPQIVIERKEQLAYCE